jgi:hypothetical protein
MQSNAILLCFESSPNTNILMSSEHFYSNVLYFSEKDETYGEAVVRRAEEINNALKFPRNTIVGLYNNCVPIFRRSGFVEKPICLFIDETGNIHPKKNKIFVNEDNIYYMKMNWRKNNDAHPIDYLRIKRKL